MSGRSAIALVAWRDMRERLRSKAFLASTLLILAFGVAALAVFAVIELFMVREPMLNLRLFSNRTFLNAALVGYVATVALFGAEFMMPVYLQTFRGYTALATGDRKSVV